MNEIPLLINSRAWHEFQWLHSGSQTLQSNDTEILKQDQRVKLCFKVGIFKIPQEQWVSQWDHDHR